jgi:predicted RNA-binding Zn-ribbon protein involved in translation (DUF1610 family)
VAQRFRSVPRTLIHARSMPDSTCPLCASRLAAHVPRPESDREDFDCPNCGRYSLARSLLGTFTWEARRAATLSHAIRRMQRPKERPVITSPLAKAIEAEGAAGERAGATRQSCLALGSVLVEPGDTRSLRAPDMRAILGSVTENAAAWTLQARAAPQAAARGQALQAACPLKLHVQAAWISLLRQNLSCSIPVFTLRCGPISAAR